MSPGCPTVHTDLPARGAAAAMKLIRVDYPLHVVQEVLGTLAGRIATFFATYLAAYLAVLLVSGLTRLVWDSVREPLLYGQPAWDWLLAVLFFVPALAALQGFGLLTYGGLLLLFVSFVWFERPAGRVLPAAFFLQTFEVVRCSCQFEGWESLLYADTIAIAILWGLGLAGYLALRRRDAPPLLGS